MAVSSLLSPLRRAMAAAAKHAAADGCPPLLACHVYVSEGRNPEVLQQIVAGVSAVPLAALVRVFQDIPYNRSGISLAGPPEPLRAAVRSVALAAVSAIDIQQHAGSHPRIGAVDNIAVHPLHDTNVQDAAEAATMLAQQIGTDAQVPVYLYGAAQTNRRPLDEIRRALGYFRGSRSGEWSGPKVDGVASIPPDYGPVQVPPRSGCIAIGAVPWVVNFNVVLETTDLPFGKRIARAVSERGGGLLGTQAMALTHESGSIEVACNILDKQKTSPSAVLARVEELCLAEKIQVRKSYFPGLLPEDALEMWRQSQSTAAQQHR